MCLKNTTYSDIPLTWLTGNLSLEILKCFKTMSLDHQNVHVNLCFISWVRLYSIMVVKVFHRSQQLPKRYNVSQSSIHTKLLSGNGLVQESIISDPNLRQTNPTKNYECRTKINSSDVYFPRWDEKTAYMINFGDNVPYW